jgi:flavodoxin
MKTAIIYYSLSGNTKKVADALRLEFTKKGKVDLFEIKPLDESNNFFQQSKRAFLKRDAKIYDIQTDLSEYDLVCLGTPVWAFGPAPAMRAYLKMCSGVSGKTILLFLTSGGMGNSRCFKEMESILKEKNSGAFIHLSYPQSKLTD